jgi:hypothetical protein
MVRTLFTTVRTLGLLSMMTLPMIRLYGSTSSRRFMWATEPASSKEVGTCRGQEELTSAFLRMG